MFTEDDLEVCVVRQRNKKKKRKEQVLANKDAYPFLRCFLVVVVSLSSRRSSSFFLSSFPVVVLVVVIDVIVTNIFSFLEVIVIPSLPEFRCRIVFNVV